jgi:hypothetical protein
MTIFESDNLIFVCHLCATTHQGGRTNIGIFQVGTDCLRELAEAAEEWEVTRDYKILGRVSCLHQHAETWSLCVNTANIQECGLCRTRENGGMVVIYGQLRSDGYAHHESYYHARCILPVTGRTINSADLLTELQALRAVKF